MLATGKNCWPEEQRGKILEPQNFSQLPAIVVTWQSMIGKEKIISSCKGWLTTHNLLCQSRDKKIMKEFVVIKLHTKRVVKV